MLNVKIKLLLIIYNIALITSAYSEVTESAIKKALDSLVEGTPKVQIEKALNIIKAANLQAFPYLIKHLGDSRRASYRDFARDRVDVDSITGRMKAHHPTIGDVAFDLIQGAIEGNRQKGYTNLYALTPQNVHDWLAKRKGYTLQQLRVAAAQESLEKANARYHANPSIETLADVKFAQSFLNVTLKKK
jgi:hypothetical protein